MTRAAPVVVFGVLALITALVHAEQVAQHRERIQRHTEDVVVQASRRLQILVDAGLAGAEVFGRRWATHESRDFSRKRFHDFGLVLRKARLGMKQSQPHLFLRGFMWGYSPFYSSFPC